MLEQQTKHGIENLLGKRPQARRQTMSSVLTGETYKQLFLS
jgi:hypothetical protein